MWSRRRVCRKLVDLWVAQKTFYTHFYQPVESRTINLYYGCSAVVTGSGSTVQTITIISQMEKQQLNILKMTELLTGKTHLTLQTGSRRGIHKGQRWSMMFLRHREHTYFWQYLACDLIWCNSVILYYTQYILHVLWQCTTHHRKIQCNVKCKGIYFSLNVSKH